MATRIDQLNRDGTTETNSHSLVWPTTTDTNRKSNALVVSEAYANLDTHSGTAQAGGANTITLAAGASATHNAYNLRTISITGGTGSGQTALVCGYNGTTKVATVSTNWSVNPDTTSTYSFAASRNPVIGLGYNQYTAGTLISGTPVVQATGTAQAGAAKTITLAAGASATDNVYNGQVVTITGGTGSGQARLIHGYVGATKVASVANAWSTNPDATSTYSIGAVEFGGNMHMEGNFFFSPNPTIEYYVQFTSGNADTYRPFFANYEKTTGKPGLCVVTGGKSGQIRFTLEDNSGDASTSTFSIESNTLAFNAPTTATTGTAANRFLDLNSYSGFGTYLRMSAGGSTLGTIGTFEYSVSDAGSGKRTFAVTAPTVSGQINIFNIKPQFATYDGLILSIGSGYQNAILNVDNTGFPASFSCIYVRPKASQTAPMVYFEGNNNGTGAVEGMKWALHPKGHITVRESGNTTTDRSASTGASTANFTATNKPGASTAVGPTMWFPMLSTAGALFWVPGWAD